MRKTPLVTDEYYHIYNRGVDKRNIFSDHFDIQRFFKSMESFNTLVPIGSLFENNFRKDDIKQEPLVEFVAYCLLPNHFHFLLKQKAEDGISQFMKRLLGGYTWYFNNRYKRSGALFQGAFKSTHIDSDEYLLYVSGYVNLNDRQKEPLGDRTAKLPSFSSWHEYVGNNKNGKHLTKICLGKEIIMDRFKTSDEYEKFAISALELIKENKLKYKDLEIEEPDLAVRSPSKY